MYKSAVNSLLTETKKKTCIQLNHMTMTYKSSPLTLVV